MAPPSWPATTVPETAFHDGLFFKLTENFNKEEEHQERERERERLEREGAGRRERNARVK